MPLQSMLHALMDFFHGFLGLEIECTAERVMPKRGRKARGPVYEGPEVHSVREFISILLHLPTSIEAQGTC
jgi:hypothetical protein